MNYLWTVEYKDEVYTSEESCNLYELWENAEIGYQELFEYVGAEYPEDEDEQDALFDEVSFSCHEIGLKE